MFSIVTDKDFIPIDKDGDANLLVLENKMDNINSSDEPSQIYILLDSVSSFDIYKLNNDIPYIRLHVKGRPSIKIIEEQKSLLINIINKFCSNMSDDGTSTTISE